MTSDGCAAPDGGTAPDDRATRIDRWLVAKARAGERGAYEELIRRHRDRIYRIGGFLILALAVGRIFLVDVWKLETIYRILSFMVLGIVLLALGFVYNRYADKIRRWL